MRSFALAGLLFALVATDAAQACEAQRIITCAGATYCAVEGEADGAWVSYRSPTGPVRYPKVPDSGEVVLIFVEVEGNFGTQRIYTLGSFADCTWAFENDYVSRSQLGRRILSWKRLDEPQYAE